MRLNEIVHTKAELKAAFGALDASGAEIVVWGKTGCARYWFPKGWGAYYEQKNLKTMKFERKKRNFVDAAYWREAKKKKKLITSANKTAQKVLFG